MRIPFAPLVLLLANIAACAQAGDSLRGDGAVDRPSATEADAPSGSLMPECTVDAAVNLNPSVVDVLILFDGSGSMAIGFGSGTRYSAVSDVLSRRVDDYQSRIRFGFAKFPVADARCSSQTVTGCCAGPASVGIAPNNGAAVQEALKNVLPLAGSTPTASALRHAREYYAGLDDRVADRYVLLATDGLPSCTLSGALSSSQPADAGLADACQDAVAQVKALVSDGVKVVVLAVGAELTDDPAGPPDCLEQMAQAGGMAQPPPSRGYYSAASTEILQETLEGIFGGVALTSCSLELSPSPGSPPVVSVYLDGQQIPQNAWEFVQASDAGNLPRIQIVGEYCYRIQHFRYSTIVANYGCPPCADKRNCPF